MSDGLATHREELGIFKKQPSSVFTPLKHFLCHLVFANILQEVTPELVNEWQHHQTTLDYSEFAISAFNEDDGWNCPHTNYKQWPWTFTIHRQETFECTDCDEKDSSTSTTESTLASQQHPYLQTFTIHHQPDQETKPANCKPGKHGISTLLSQQHPNPSSCHQKGICQVNIHLCCAVMYHMSHKLIVQRVQFCKTTAFTRKTRASEL